MIDNGDLSKSTLRLLVYQALKMYPLRSLHPLLLDPNNIVRSAVARELQVRGELETFLFIKSLVADSRRFVREICAFTLGQLGTPTYPFRDQAMPILIDLAGDVSDDVRAAAIAAIGHSNAHKYAHVLIAAAGDSSPFVRSSAAAALGAAGDVRGVLPVLRGLMLDPHPDVREWAQLSIEILSDASSDNL